MPFKDHDYPGYIGYNVIANAALQTGIHCCDIAMHISSIINNPLLKSAQEFLEQPSPRKQPLFGTCIDEATSILTAENILIKFLQRKRRELCNFAIKKIQDPQESIIYCMLLAPEIREAIKDSILGGRDFSTDKLSSDKLRDECLVCIEEFNKGNEQLLVDFCEKPEVCIEYIKSYYLTGNNRGDDAKLAKMFIVPRPDSTGMLNIAAMYLKRKIVVVSATNGDPFITEDYSNGTNPPIYIGYDGRLHFVELRPYTISQLSKISDSMIATNLEKILYESIIAVAIVQQTKEMQPQHLVEALQRLSNLKVQYAEIKTAARNLEGRLEKFMKLLIQDPNILKDQDNPQVKELYKLYDELLANQQHWLNTSKLSKAEVIRARQIQAQNGQLQHLIKAKVSDLNKDINKALVNIVWGASESTIALDAKIMAAHDMAQQLQDFFVAHAYIKPNIPRVNEVTPAPVTSWLQKFKDFVYKIVTPIFYVFHAMYAAITSRVVSKPSNETAISKPNVSEDIKDKISPKSIALELPKTSGFTPLMSSKKEIVVAGPEPFATEPPKDKQKGRVRSQSW